MADLSVGAALASYLPTSIVNDCFARVKNNVSQWEPKATNYAGAVVFCDISGFTALTERLAKEGPDGAEKLVAFLCDYFGQLIALVLSHGGDVMNFAGDALLAVFREATPEELKAKIEDIKQTIDAELAIANEDNGIDLDEQKLHVLRTARRALQEQMLGKKDEDEDAAVSPLVSSTRRAVQCAFAMMTRMNTGVENQPRLHMGVGAGGMSLLQVGGKNDRWVFTVCGEPLEQIGPACGAASPDFTVLSPEVWALVSDMAFGDEIMDGMVKLTGVKNSYVGLDLTLVREYEKVTGPLRMFIPKVIQINTGARTARATIAELRRVTVIFINIIGLSMKDGSCLMRVHEVIATVQDAIYKYGGLINKVLLDDKGFVILAGFGLPPVAKENDPERGVMAASVVKHNLGLIGVQCSVGITTGRAFCGIVGSTQRREYTMIGDAVNTSARLMTASKDSVLCDRATMSSAKASNYNLAFKELEPRKFKGKQNTIDVFEVQFESAFLRRSLEPPTAEVTDAGLVGRSRELTAIASEIGDVKSGEATSSRVIIIEGDAGTGKTRLLRESQRYAAAFEAPVYQACGDQIYKTSAFHPWVGVFEDVFRLYPDMGRLVREAGVSQAILMYPKFPPGLAPLLNSFLSLDLPVTEESQALKGKAMYDKIVELLAYVFKTKTATDPALLLIEDLQMFDKLSRELLDKVVTTATNTLVMITVRPSFSRDHFASILSWAGTQHAVLEPLSRIAIVKIFCDRLGASSISRMLENVVVKKCGGNPLFAEEMAYALKGSRAVKVVYGRCRLADGVSHWSIPLPDTLEGFVMCQIDRLGPSKVQMLKVASAIGEQFDFMLLYDLYPRRGETDEAFLKQMQADMEDLVRDAWFYEIESGEDIAEDDERSPTSLVYAFKNSITHEIVSRLMLYEERTQLHCAIAKWYERTALDLSSGALLLSYHWRCGGKISTAVHYLEMSATIALHADRNYQAYSDLREILALGIVSESAITQACVYRKLAQAAFALSEELEAIHYLSAAVNALRGQVIAEVTNIVPVFIREVKRLEANAMKDPASKKLRAEMDLLQRMLEFEDNQDSARGEDPEMKLDKKAQKKADKEAKKAEKEKLKAEKKKRKLSNAPTVESAAATQLSKFFVMMSEQGGEVEEHKRPWSAYELNARENRPPASAGMPSDQLPSPGTPAPGQMMVGVDAFPNIIARPRNPMRSTTGGGPGSVRARAGGIGAKHQNIEAALRSGGGVGAPPPLTVPFVPPPPPPPPPPPAQPKKKGRWGFRKGKKDKDKDKDG